MAASSERRLYCRWTLVLLVVLACARPAAAQDLPAADGEPEPAAADVMALEKRAFETLSGLVGRFRPSAAVPELIEAAELGSAAAMAQLGTMYMEGEGMSRDTGEAMRLMRAAADLGNFTGQVFLGGVYLFGEGVDRDPAQAQIWLEAAANQGEPFALFQLAELYASSGGGEAEATLRYELLSRSAELANAEARRELGILLFRDADRRDPAKAIYLLELVAPQDAAAARELGYQYLTGQHSERNFVKAAQWMSTAAAMGDIAAALMFADITEKGAGVEADPERARQLRAPIIAAATAEQRNNIAWRYAVAPGAILRNGNLAVGIMEELLASPESVNAMRLDTLAAAYAEAGRFEDAIAAQEAAIERLLDAGNVPPSPAADAEAMLADLRSRLDGYRAGHAYRMPY